MTVPETYAGTHTGCGGTIAFTPRDQESALLAGHAVTLQTACSQCGQTIAIHAKLGAQGEMELVAAPTAPAPAPAGDAQLGAPRLVDEPTESPQLFPPHAPQDPGVVPTYAPAPASADEIAPAQEHAMRQAAHALALVSAGAAQEPQVVSEPGGAVPPLDPMAHAGSSAYQQELEQRVAAARELVDRAQEGLPSMLSTDAFRLPTLSEPTSSALRALEERPYYEEVAPEPAPEAQPETLAPLEPQPQLVAQPDTQAFPQPQPQAFPQPEPQAYLPDEPQPQVVQPEPQADLSGFWAQTPLTQQQLAPQPQVTPQQQPVVEQHIAPQYAPQVVAQQPTYVQPGAQPVQAQQQAAMPTQPLATDPATLQFAQQSAPMAGATQHQPALVSPPADLELSDLEPRGFDWGDGEVGEERSGSSSLIGMGKLLLVAVLFVGIGYLAFDTVQRLRDDPPAKKSSGSKKSSTKSEKASPEDTFEVVTGEEAGDEADASAGTKTPATGETVEPETGVAEEETTTTDAETVVPDSAAGTLPEGEIAPDGDLDTAEPSAGAQDLDTSADTTQEASNPFD